MQVKKGLGKLSIEVRRRTDQQSNFLSRTVPNWQKEMIADQERSIVQRLENPQRSVDLTDVMKSAKMKDSTRT